MSKARGLADLGNQVDDGAITGSNMVVNGAMQVAQRGTSSTSSGFQTVDRFKSGTQTIGITQSQESITSGAPFEEGFLDYYRQTVTTPSSASNVIMEIKHSIEAQNIAGSGWNFKSASKSLTLSFYVRSSVSGTYYSYIRNTDASPEQFYRFSFVLSANTWTKVEKTIAGNSNLVFSNDNGEGLAIFWVPAFGTSYTGSSVNLDQWETLTGSDYIPDITHAWGNTSGATFDLTGVQLELGDTATPFEHRSYGDELARCQRYYEKSYNQSTASGTATHLGSRSSGGNAAANTTGEIGGYFPFIVAKRVTPSVTIWDQSGNQGKTTISLYGTGTTANQTSSVSNISETVFFVSRSSGSNATELYVQFAADAEL